MVLHLVDQIVTHLLTIGRDDDLGFTVGRFSSLVGRLSRTNPPVLNLDHVPLLLFIEHLERVRGGTLNRFGRHVVPLR
jgi:hypothetical protein